MFNYNSKTVLCKQCSVKIYLKHLFCFYPIELKFRTLAIAHQINQNYTKVSLNDFFGQKIQKKNKKDIILFTITVLVINFVKNFNYKISKEIHQIT